MKAVVLQFIFITKCSSICL